MYFIYYTLWFYRLKNASRLGETWKHFRAECHSTGLALQDQYVRIY